MEKVIGIASPRWTLHVPYPPIFEIVQVLEVLICIKIVHACSKTSD